MVCILYCMLILSITFNYCVASIDVGDGSASTKKRNILSVPPILSHHWKVSVPHYSGRGIITFDLRRGENLDDQISNYLKFVELSGGNRDNLDRQFIFKFDLFPTDFDDDIRYEVPSASKFYEHYERTKAMSPVSSPILPRRELCSVHTGLHVCIREFNSGDTQVPSANPTSGSIKGVVEKFDEKKVQSGTIHIGGRNGGNISSGEHQYYTATTTGPPVAPNPHYLPQEKLKA